MKMSVLEFCPFMNAAAMSDARSTWNWKSSVPSKDSSSNSSKNNGTLDWLGWKMICCIAGSKSWPAVAVFCPFPLCPATTVTLISNVCSDSRPSSLMRKMLSVSTASCSLNVYDEDSNPILIPVWGQKVLVT